jgi:hypothetical protein
MADEADYHIAPNKRPADWIALCTKLSIGAPAGWPEAFEKYFEARLRSRYLDPIKVIQDHGDKQGEGFAIVAIQCSMIEFLESTEQGINYRCRNPNKELYEYSRSKDVFTSFLRNRQPFSGTFGDDSLAQDFYENVRCPLLHEARTRKWRIRADGPGDCIASPEMFIVYRNNFQDALQSYISEYGNRLPLESALQETFKRKFNDLCK